MRSFVICSFIVLSIYLVSDAVSAQSFFPSTNSKPFYAASSNSVSNDPNPSTPKRQNIIQRVFGWLRRPSTESSEPVAESSDEQQFNSHLPKASTDKLINDAISDRLIEESRSQQIISGSPYIEANGRTDEYQASASESKPQTLNPSLSVPNGKIPLTEALRIVNTANLTNCVERVICELSCNANSYGNPGRAVFRNLIKLQFDQSIRGDDAKHFRQAASKGRQLVQNKRPCKDCYEIYPNCNSSSNDLIAVSSMFNL